MAVAGDGLPSCANSLHATLTYKLQAPTLRQLSATCTLYTSNTQQPLTRDPEPWAKTEQPNSSVCHMSYAARHRYHTQHQLTAANNIICFQKNHPNNPAASTSHAFVRATCRGHHPLIWLRLANIHTSSSCQALSGLLPAALCCL